MSLSRSGLHVKWGPDAFFLPKVLNCLNQLSSSGSRIYNLLFVWLGGIWENKLTKVRISKRPFTEVSFQPISKSHSLQNITINAEQRMKIDCDLMITVQPLFFCQQYKIIDQMSWNLFSVGEKDSCNDQTKRRWNQTGISASVPEISSILWETTSVPTSSSMCLKQQWRLLKKASVAASISCVGAAIDNTFVLHTSLSQNPK